MLEYHEPPDPFVPAAEWAVVNVSGQRFQINMKHIKEQHRGATLFSTYTETRILETLMGDTDFEKYHWDSERSEYFIDRHRGTFEVISNWMMRQGPLGTRLETPITWF